MPFSHFITGLDSTEPFHRIVQHVHVGDGEGVGGLIYMGKMCMQPLFRLDKLIQYLHEDKQKKKLITYSAFLKTADVPAKHFFFLFAVSFYCRLSIYFSILTCTAVFMLLFEVPVTTLNNNF